MRSRALSSPVGAISGSKLAVTPPDRPAEGGSVAIRERPVAGVDRGSLRRIEAGGERTGGRNACLVEPSSIAGRNLGSGPRMPAARPT
jgi:hypothetical protein